MLTSLLKLGRYLIYNEGGRVPNTLLSKINSYLAKYLFATDVILLPTLLYIDFFLLWYIMEDKKKKTKKERQKGLN